MMTLTFVVCYGFLAFATAVFIYGVCLKRTNLVNQDGFKTAITCFTLFWPIYWVIMIVILSIHWIKKSVKFCGEKFAEHLRD